MNICTKYGFDILIISGSYGGHRRHTTYSGRRTMPRVWHKLPTGELKILSLGVGSNMKIIQFKYIGLLNVHHSIMKRICEY